jgi:hypothetical protein
MKLDELAQALPNGFHDSRLASIRIDYDRRELTLDIEVWIGEMDADDLASRETYRPAVLTLYGLEFCAIEPPDPSSRHLGRELTIDTGDLKSLPPLATANLPVPVSDTAFTNWIFVSQWNAFIYVSANEARLDWKRDSEPDVLA